ncbi:MAG TPA: hypothetical protein VI544_00695 [Candidatus Nanoarchaeia archaeon]|nr:hypothetical protein [Candidatus Nanoarchaeia archaeon]
MRKNIFYEMKIGLVTWLFVFAIFAFLVANVSALFIGLTDGYIFNVTGGIVSGATVVTTVSGCSGGASNGCTGMDTSDANGYYIINNLNLPQSGTVNVSANKSGGTGSNSGSADNTQVAHVNVTICYAPSSPSLTAVPDSHNTTAELSWTSGVDPFSFATYDQLDFDGATPVNDSSPTTKVGLSYTTHTWQIRTFSNYCCSSWVSDSFDVTNSAPSAPSNLNSTTSNATTTLNWTSGTDPEGDATYDEVSYQNGTTISSPATAPLTITTVPLIKWRVRTCDSIGDCSAWVEEDTLTGTIICATETVCSTEESEEVSSAGGSTGVYGPGRFGAKKTELYCNGIPFMNTTLLRLNIGFEKNVKKVSIYGMNFTLEDLEYCPWCYNGLKDYDETGVDCGGNCRSCTDAETPISARENYLKILALSIALSLLIIYILYRKGILNRAASALLGHGHGFYGIPGVSSRRS